MAEFYEKLPTDGEEVRLKLSSYVTAHPIPDFTADVMPVYEEDEDFPLSEDLDDEADETQHLEITTGASFSEEGGRVTVTYDDSEILELPKTLTQITFTRDEPDVVTIIRSGGLRSMFVIEEGRHHASEYKLGPYNLPVSVYGRRVRNSIGKGEGELELDYIVELSGADTQRTRMKITVTR